MNESFVSFCGTVIERYDSTESLPPHSKMDPKLLHGQIHVTITAKTPIMISDGTPKNEGGVSVSRFSRDGRNCFRIPGSSLRGLIRQNMQILGLGSVTVQRGGDISEERVSGNREPKLGIDAVHSKNLIDYPRSIMGFVMQEKVANTAKHITKCYRSRISVGDLLAQDSPRELPTVLMQQYQPKQSDPKFIVERGSRFSLKGFRQYPPRPIRSDSPEATQGFRPLPAGTRFTGVIRYRNLHADELGLLLWCLRLEPGCTHAMGMGKGSGYGQVTITIDSLTEFVPNSLYADLTSTGTHTPDPAKRIEDLIQTYRHKASTLGLKGQDPGQMPHIRTFLALRKTTLRR